MVAELLRLRLRLLVGGVRRSTGALVAAVVAMLLVVALLGVALAAALLLSRMDAIFVQRIVPVVGATLLVLAFGIPVVTAPPELIEVRALRGYHLPRVPVALVLLIATLLGPAIAFVALALLPFLVWNTPEAVTLTAWCAPLLVLQALLLLRLGVSTGAVLVRHPRIRRIAVLLVVLVLVATLLLVGVLALPRLLGLLPAEWVPPLYPLLDLIGRLRLEAAVNAIAASPVGAAWAAPGLAEDGRDPGVALLLAIVLAAVLLGLWILVVLRGFTPTVRTRAARKRGVPGWFRAVPAGATGAVAARSISYWSRDPRYGVAFALVPLVPAIAVVGMWLGGIPFSIGAFIPLPLVLLLVAWGSLHNDVAMDSTAVWQHVTAQTPGVADRLGRAVPVAAIGLVLLAVGVPLSVWMQGSLASWPALLGLCLALLAGGIGVSSAASAILPYPVAHPGERAFRQPEMFDSGGFGAQALSLVATLLVAAPALAFAVLWLIQPGEPWNWAALAAGAGAGAVALALGLRVGARAFDEGTPELLAAAMRH
ncbi:MAG: hypothetical protein J0G30_07690 [Actinomycetales bacterium]|nr:hypothetical protein [Actinomycetales bacterium]